MDGAAGTELKERVNEWTPLPLAVADVASSDV
jgi:hypothetical protein